MPSEFTTSTYGFQVHERSLVHDATVKMAVIREIKIAKIVRCGVFTKYTSRENLYAYGIIIMDIHMLTFRHDTHSHENCRLWKSHH